MDYITIASEGDAQDFGDFTANNNQGSTSNETRGLFAGGHDGSTAGLVTIEYITIASTGDSTDFGDMTVGRYTLGGCASATRGVFVGGKGNPGGGAARTNVMDYVTIASAGDAADFGDTSVTRYRLISTDNGIRGVNGGGLEPAKSNVLDYITIASTGNAADFGDLTSTRGGSSAASDSRGALQG
jgi:hypothetical protein